MIHIEKNRKLYFGVRRYQKLYLTFKFALQGTKTKACDFIIFVASQLKVKKNNHFFQYVTTTPDMRLLFK